MDFHYSAEVTKARKAGTAIVALESTIITHGMPFPQNRETAERVEQTVRDAGATPATIAVLDGNVHIGLDQSDLEALSLAKDVWKLSRADLGACIAQQKTGSTTVAATMILAAKAGIEVFATGGIGGVHRGAEDSFDISADLIELSQTPVCVVCAGAKAILDLPKTLEVLETNGVPVIGFQTDNLPAFWSRDSGLPCPLRAETPAEIARAFKVRQELGLSGGQLIANPIPREAEIPVDELRPVITKAIAKAEKQGIAAKNVTPFLLSEIYRLTKGASLQANIALVLNNARLAAEIAQALHEEC